MGYAIQSNAKPRLYNLPETVDNYRERATELWHNETGSTNVETDSVVEETENGGAVVVVWGAEV